MSAISRIALFAYLNEVANPVQALGLGALRRPLSSS